MCNFNVIAVLEFISRGLYLLFAILLTSKFQNSKHMRPKSGLNSLGLFVIVWKIMTWEVVVFQMSRDARNPIFGVSDQVRHKPACTVTEAG